MSIIIPAILPEGFTELEKKVEAVASHVPLVQLDVCDGNFVDSVTWPYKGSPALAELIKGQATLPCIDTVHYEVDLMVANPKEVLGDWIAAGATRLIVHVASTDDLKGIIHMMKHSYGYDRAFARDLLSLGLAVGLDTPLSDYQDYVEEVDSVQFMGIQRLGHQGQKFDDRVFKKIKQFRIAFPEHEIHVDGGVTLDTAPKLLEAGVNHLAVGSALFKTESVPHTLQKFEKLKEQYGLYQ